MVSKPTLNDQAPAGSANASSDDRRLRLHRVLGDAVHRPAGSAADRRSLRTGFDAAGIDCGAGDGPTWGVAVVRSGKTDHYALPARRTSAAGDVRSQAPRSVGSAWRIRGDRHVGPRRAVLRVAPRIGATHGQAGGRTIDFAPQRQPRSGGTGRPDGTLASAQS